MTELNFDDENRDLEDQGDLMNLFDSPDEGEDDAEVFPDEVPPDEIDISDDEPDPFE